MSGCFYRTGKGRQWHMTYVTVFGKSLDNIYPHFFYVYVFIYALVHAVA